MTLPKQPPANDPGFKASLIRRPMTYASQRDQRVRYLMVGVWNTVFAYAEWALLQYLLHDYLHYLVILVLAWPLAVINAYYCHRRFVFRSSASIREELPRFSLVYVATLVAGIVVLPILLATLPFSIYVIQAGYTVTVVVLSYVAHKFFSFGGQPRSSEAAVLRGTDDD